MKKYILIIGVLLALTSCDDNNVTFDGVNGQTGVSFAASSFNVAIPAEGLALQIPVNVTTVSTSDRSFDVTVDDSSVGGSENFSIGSVTIAGGSYSGILDVNLNFDPLVDGVVYQLNLNLEAPQGGVAFDETVNIEYFKVIVCNDFVLTVVTDVFGSETTWEITDASDTVVESGGPYVDVAGGDTYLEEFSLVDGCYTFTIFDSYRDGQVSTGGTLVGSWSLECSILQVANGGGAFGASESTDFCVNQ